jgi:hypothetical protein
MLQKLIIKGLTKKVKDLSEPAPLRGARHLILPNQDVHALPD